MNQRRTLEKIEQYLRQQQELFGENLYVEKEGTPPPPNSVSAEHTAPPEASEQLFEDGMKKKKKSDSHFEFPDTSGDDKFGVIPGWEMSKSLDELKEQIEHCQKCPLGKTRTKFVFGTGNPDADIVVIGEAPGAEEDATGFPFVGRAGQMLTKILESIQLTRDEVYICNIIKSRPPGNRRPAPDEIDACEPYLWKQLELIHPQFIFALGLTAVNTLFRANYKMADIRGNLLDYHGVQVLATYHPAAILRNPQWKRPVWEDVQMLRRLYDEYLEKSGKKK